MRLPEWGGAQAQMAVLVPIGVNASGYLKILGIAEGAKEGKAGWFSFLRHLKERGLAGSKWDQKKNQGSTLTRRRAAIH